MLNMLSSLCNSCIHKNVCGNIGSYEEVLRSCKAALEAVPGSERFKFKMDCEDYISTCESSPNECGMTILDEAYQLHEDYVRGFAKNHNLTIEEARMKPMVKAHLEYVEWWKNNSEQVMSGVYSEFYEDPHNSFLNSAT